MGKESELWDDSALMNAFDDAMTKYKAMHKKEHKGISTDGEEVMSDNPEILIDGNQEATRLVKADHPSNAALNNGTDVKEANDVPAFQGNHQAGSSDPEPFVHASSSHMPQALEDYTNSQGESEYNKLLSQYYELEEQRQKVLQQLQQVGYGYYPSQGEGSGSCAYTCCSTQEHQDRTHFASQQAVVSSCCPYVCPCLTGSWPSIPACSLGGACVSKMGTYSVPIACTSDPAKVSSLQDDPVVKTAMGAAERAIASIKMEASNTSNIQQVKDKKELPDSLEGEMAQSSSSETDLTAVFNAWYSAGFYTGKYLSEQSIAKRRNE
ncbi:hypothetical protein BVC80_9095g63 [Macleaya cordata]|uniref:Survival Motor Neuron Gemin2-binding domain-containing protein n=1 Tax=Macleaya cordata TaxID=56857 RepID=A0A200PXB2_MACCD|nr:hypothetical protein BVC80_9095g63 [Macleaya cordata]